MARHAGRDPHIVQINEEYDLDIPPETGGHAVAEYAHLEEEGGPRRSPLSVVILAILVIIALGFPVLWVAGLLVWSTPVFGLSLGVVWLALLALLLVSAVYFGAHIIGENL